MKDKKSSDDAMSLEMKGIIDAISVWHESHRKKNEEVGFAVSFFAFKKDTKATLYDDRMFLYGYRGVLKISLEHLLEILDKQVDDSFVNI